MIHRHQQAARGFTLVEMLVVLAVIMLLATTVLLALQGAMEDARESRTRSQIAHIHEQLMFRWQSYRSRPVPLRLPSSFLTRDNSNNPVRQRLTARIAAQLRLAALRDLQRLEMPDRRLDVDDLGPSLLFYENDLDANAGTPGRWGAYQPGTIAEPSLHRAYHAFVTTRMGSTNWNNWSLSFQGAECLYMVLANIKQGGNSALDFFKQSEIGDVDGDNMPEILDAWGRPIEFIRWPAGFSAFPGPDMQWGVAGVDDDQDGQIDNPTEAGWLGSDDLASPSNLQDRGDPDPFDFFKVDYRWWNTDGSGNPIYVDQTFALFPLVYSAGRDGIYDIIADTTEPVYTSPAPLRYPATMRPQDPNRALIGLPGPYPNDPYIAIDGLEIGRPADLPSYNWSNLVEIEQNPALRSVGVDGLDNSRDNIHNHRIEAR